MDTPTVVQALTLVLVVVAFDTWERVRPGHVVDRRRFLRLDIIAMLVVIAGGELWKVLLLSGLHEADAKRAFAGFSALHELPSAAKIALGLLAADLCLYWVHRAMHASNLLWRTHVFHHSIKELYWLSGSRTSLTHLFLFAVPQVLLCYFLFGLTPIEAGIAFSIGVVVNLWVHTNLSVDLGRLQWLLITPDYHRIHHTAGDLSRKNLGFILTIWDRMFGTYVDPRSVMDVYPLGSAGDGENTARLIVGV